MADLVRIEGLAETRRALRSMHDAEGLVEIRDSLREVAGLVADKARSSVPVRTGRAAASVRPLVSGNRAYVAGGTGTVPYYGWLDFGTRTPVRGNPRSRGPWSGSGTGPAKGRFIYPAIDNTHDQIEKAVGKGVDRLIKKAGFV